MHAELWEAERFFSQFSSLESVNSHPGMEIASPTPESLRFRFEGVKVDRNIVIYRKRGRIRRRSSSAGGVCKFITHVC